MDNEAYVGKSLHQPKQMKPWSQFTVKKRVETLLLSITIWFILFAGGHAEPFELRFTFDPPVIADNSYFGESVALGGDHAVIGLPALAEPGSIAIFSNDDGNTVHVLDSPDGQQRSC